MMVSKVLSLDLTTETNMHSVRDTHANAEDTSVRCMKDSTALNAERKYSIMILTLKSSVGLL